LVNVAAARHALSAEARGPYVRSNFKEHSMTTHCTAAALLAVALCTPASAQQTDRRPGDHPAVIVQRLHAQQGYDYASKFYPHPAWLYLEAEAPHPMMEHPAVVVFRQHQQEAAAEAQRARGWNVLRAMDCARCHGRDYEGWAAPSLIAGVRDGSRERFDRWVLDGDTARGMPGYRSQPLVAAELDAIYAYLLARARGDVGPDRL
jgi:mono/diheme cytochrome c family protein